MTVARSYGLTAQSLVSGQINYASDTIKAALFSTAYTPNQDTQRYYTDLTGEVTGTNYTAGGLTITGKTVTYDAGTNTLTLSSTVSPLNFANVTVTNFRYVVIYDSAGSKPLLCYVDFEADYDATAEDVKVAVPATGFLQLVVA